MKYYYRQQLAPLLLPNQGDGWWPAALGQTSPLPKAATQTWNQAVFTYCKLGWIGSHLYDSIYSLLL